MKRAFLFFCFLTFLPPGLPSGPPGQNRLLLLRKKVSEDRSLCRRESALSATKLSKGAAIVAQQYKGTPRVVIVGNAKLPIQVVTATRLGLNVRGDAPAPCWEP